MSNAPAPAEPDPVIAQAEADMKILLGSFRQRGLVPRGPLWDWAAYSIQQEHLNLDFVVAAIARYSTDRMAGRQAMFDAGLHDDLRAYYDQQISSFVDSDEGIAAVIASPNAVAAVVASPRGIDAVAANPAALEAVTAAASRVHPEPPT